MDSNVKHLATYSILRFLSVLLILVAAGYQTTLSLDIVPKITWDGLQGSAYIRSARSLEGSEFAEYIQLLRSEIPPEARVMLPPRTIFHPIAHMGLMQFLLFPRELHNCGPNEVEACIGRVNESEDFYILSIWDFPPEDIVIPTRSLIEYSEDLGVFLPPN